MPRARPPALTPQGLVRSRRPAPPRARPPRGREYRVAVGALEVVADLLGALRGLVGQLGGLVLALAAQVVTDRPRVLGRGLDLLAGLRRAGVDLGADAVACRALGLLGLVLGDLGRLLRLLLGAARGLTVRCA